jgi:nitroreductase
VELTDALRTTGSIRHFNATAVADDVVYAILDDARFAPSGGNRQAWHVIVVRDPVVRRSMRDLYLDAWHDYVAQRLAGLVPFSPVANEDDRARALAQRDAAITLSDPTGFPEKLDTVPVMLVVCAKLNLLAATDKDLDRYQLVGGASIYPFVWSIMLAAHERGLGSVMTTVATRNEPQVSDLLHVPSTYAIAAVVAMGYVNARASRLNRHRVEEFTTIDRLDGTALHPA